MSWEVTSSMAGTQGTGNAPSWQVTTQQERSMPNARGGFDQGVQVGFRTKGGLEGSVFVPNAQYDAAHVKELIAARVASMESVQALQP
jgi:hypothetical protein